MKSRHVLPMFAMVAGPTLVSAQPSYLDLTVNDVGIAIGDAPRVTGPPGVQHGVPVGILNIAEELRGVQIGLINIARGNPRGRRVLPIVNWGSGG